MDEDLKMILMTFFGYFLFALITIIFYATFKYIWTKKKETDSEKDLGESFDKQSSLSSIMIDKVDSDYEIPRNDRIRDLAMHKCEHCGDIIPMFTNQEGSRFDEETKVTKKSLKRYNPFEWLNIDFIFDESGLQEAYSDMKQQDLIMAKQGKEFRKYKGFFAWFTGMIVINEDIIKKATSSDGYIYLLYLKSCFLFFLILSLIGIFLLCPFYYQASYQNNNTTKATFLQTITVFEVTFSEWRLWIIFF